MKIVQDRILDLALRLLWSDQGLAVRYGLPVLITVAVAALKLAVPAFGSQGADLFLTIPVAASALLAGFGPALVAVVMTTLLAAYFAPPAFRFAVGSADVLEVFGFFTEGLIIAVLGAALRGALRRTVDSLKQRDALDAERTALLATLNHELRNPLTSLSGNLQLAERYAGRDAMRDRLPAVLDDARAQVSRLIRLLDDLAVIATSSGAFHFEIAPVELGDIIAVAGRRANRLDPSRLVLAIVPPGSLTVTADPARVDQILDNLLRNAIKYSPAGSDVEISAGIDHVARCALVRVRDRGAGIGPDERERIFERFTRGSAGATVAGMGIGLYVSRAIAERMDGRLFVEESSPAGSVFRLELPLAPDVSADGERADEVGMEDGSEELDAVDEARSWAAEVRRAVHADHAGVTN